MFDAYQHTQLQYPIVYENAKYKTQQYHAFLFSNLLESDRREATALHPPTFQLHLLFILLYIATTLNSIILYV